VRLFWWASDYGSNTGRLLGVFVVLSVVFALLYLIPTPAPSWAFWPTFYFDHPFVNSIDSYTNLRPNGIHETLEIDSFWWRFLRAFYFSIVTMTTLGFGDITPHPFSLWGHVLVMAQVFFGYIILAAFVTRMAILFQDVA
jgi:hypothetical protein